MGALACRPFVRVSVLGLAIGIVGLASACGSPPAATEDAGRPARTKTTRSVRRDPDQLTRVCLQAIARARESGEGPNLQDVLRRCGDVFREEPCRGAYHLAADRRGTLDDVVNACKTAYCPQLPSPRPALCGGREVPREQKPAAWRALFRAMLELDVGRENGDRIDRSFAALADAPASRPSPDPSAPAGGSAESPPTGDAPAADLPPLVVTMTPNGGDVRIDLEGPGNENGTWTMVAGAPDTQVRDMLAPTFQRIRPRPVLLRSVGRIEVVDSMVIVSALRGLGFQEIRVQ
ncbi:MAG: hypothetical protein IT379_21270 [Deltaproteobacteria bacterium]|nr:hypothetical protein [Deltaproteobacteria bacterium]